jgi:hypothetical protein
VPAVITVVLTTKRANTDNHTFHEADTGSGKVSIQNVFKISNTMSAGDASGDFCKIRFQRIPRQTNITYPTLKLTLGHSSNTFNQAGVEPFMEAPLLQLAGTQPLDEGIWSNTSDTSEETGGDDEMKKRPRGFNKVIRRNDVIATNLIDLDLKIVNLRTINHPPCQQHVGSRQNRSNVIEQRIPGRALNPKHLRTVTQHIETAEGNRRNEAKSIIN